MTCDGFNFYFFRSDKEDEDNNEEPHCLKVLHEK